LPALARPRPNALSARFAQVEAVCTPETVAEAGWIEEAEEMPLAAIAAKSTADGTTLRA
jgi:hypothetical protein